MYTTHRALKIPERNRNARLLVLLLACLLGGQAYAQDHGSAAEVGKKLADPLSDVWALFTEIDYTWSEGDFTDGDHETSQAIIFQPVTPVNFSENFTLISRPTLPVIINQDVPDGFRCQFQDCIRPGGGFEPGTQVTFDDNTGLGDFILPLMLSPKKDDPTERFGWALGPSFVFPTATDDDLGTDTWEAGIAGILTYKTPKITALVYTQYWWSYSEQNNAEETSHASVLWGGWYNLPDAWQIGITPTLTYNDKADSDNAWNVPVGIMAAKTVKFGKLPVKFQFGVEKSIVRQEDFGKDWMFRFNIIPVIPALIEGPLF